MHIKMKDRDLICQNSEPQQLTQNKKLNQKVKKKYVTPVKDGSR